MADVLPAVWNDGLPATMLFTRDCKTCNQSKEPNQPRSHVPEQLDRGIQTFHGDVRNIADTDSTMESLRALVDATGDKHKTPKIILPNPSACQ